MAVYHPAVSERVFEFAFNSEFCASSPGDAFVAGCPYIPTQNQEKRLGYDVAIRITGGAKIYSLYLQHKVSRFVDGPSGSNAHFRHVVGLPYFSFKLDVNQYNLIHRYAQKKTREFYYCAPLFTTRKDLAQHYAAKSIVGNSAWIDVSKWASIPSADTEPHCVVYSPDMSRTSRFSEDPEKSVPAERPTVEAFLQGSSRKFTTEDMATEYLGFFDTLKEWWPDRQKIRRKTEQEDSFKMRSELPPKIEDFKRPEQVVDAIREITGEYLGVTWLVRVQE